MKRVCNVFLVLLLVLLLAPQSGWSAPEAADSSGEAAMAGAGEAEGNGKAEEEGPPDTFGPLVTESAEPVEKGALEIQPIFSFSFVTDSLTPSWRRASAGGGYTSFAYEQQITYGLWDNLEVYTIIPILVNMARSVNEPAPDGSRSATSSGMGDINLTWKYRLVGETQTLPTVSAIFSTDFPTGKYRRLNPRALGTDEMGGGAFVFTTGFAVSKYVKPVILYANLFYSMGTAFTNRGEDDDGNPIDVRNYPRDFVTVNLAAEYPLTKKWIALLELVSYWDGGRFFGHKSNVPPAALVSVVPGIEYMATDRVSMALGVQVDVLGKNTDAAVTPILSLIFSF